MMHVLADYWGIWQWSPTANCRNVCDNQRDKEHLLSSLYWPSLCCQYLWKYQPNIRHFHRFVHI